MDNDNPAYSIRSAAGATDAESVLILTQVDNILGAISGQVSPQIAVSALVSAIGILLSVLSDDSAKLVLDVIVKGLPELYHTVKQQNMPAADLMKAKQSQQCH